MEGESTQLARKQAYMLRSESTTMSPKWRTMPLTKTTGQPVPPMPGWNGVPVEAWRFAALNAFSHSFASDRHPYLDWLGGDLELDMMLLHAESLGKFWLHDVETLNMPRHWLRWAFEFLQMQYAVSDGTPVDAQIGTYLIDADLLLSADKTIVRIAEKCREDAPFAVAASLRVPGGSACVDAVLHELAAQRRHTVYRKLLRATDSAEFISTLLRSTGRHVPAMRVDITDIVQ